MPGSFLSLFRLFIIKPFIKMQIERKILHYVICYLPLYFQAKMVYLCTTKIHVPNTRYLRVLIKYFSTSVNISLILWPLYNDKYLFAFACELFFYFR